MGGNNYITQAAREQSEPKQLDYETACEALDHKPEPNGKKVLVVCDVGATVYRLCLESSFPFGSSSFFIQLVTRLFTRTVLPILYAFPNVECVLGFDACHNDLKEKYKGLRMNEDDFVRRKPGLVRSQALNCIIARLVNAVFPVLLQAHQQRRQLNQSLPDLSGASVRARVGPIEGDDTAAVEYHENAGRDDIEFMVGLYVDNDNVASGAENFITTFKLKQAGIKLLFVNDPVVNANGKLEGTFVVPMDICTEKKVHPQLLPLWAATITNDKSPGYPGIGEGKIWKLAEAASAFLSENSHLVAVLEQGLTPDWIRDLFTVLLHAGNLHQFESRERTDERIEAIIAGVNPCSKTATRCELSERNADAASASFQILPSPMPG